MRKLLLCVAFAGALGLAACIPPPKNLDEPWRCTLWGTDGPDVLESTKRGERMCGLQGEDHLIVRHANVVVMGGEGDDLIEGEGTLSTQVYPGPGDDHMSFTDPEYLSVYAWAEDALAGGELHEYPDNGEGHDHLVVQGGWLATVRLGAGNDRFDGHRPRGQVAPEPGAYTYQVHGEDGDDVLRSSGQARHIMVGGHGDDTIVVNGGLLEEAQSNNLLGGAGDDLVYALNGWPDRIQLGDEAPGGPQVALPCGPAMSSTWPPPPGIYTFSCDLLPLADHSLTVTPDDIVAEGAFIEQLMSADLLDLRSLLESLGLPSGDAAVGDHSSWPWAQN